MFTVTGKGISIKDTELIYAKTGTAIAKTTLVNQEEYNGEKTSHFTNVIAFGKVAEQLADEVSKGCLIEIKSGILKHPVNEGKNGKKYYNTEVVIFEFDMIEKFESKKKSK